MIVLANISQASRVVAWLGAATEDSGLGVDVIKRIGATWETWNRQNPYKGRISSEGQLRRWSSCSRDEMAALKGILNRIYWTRIWIVQECKLAGNLHFWIGPATTTRNDFVAMWTFWLRGDLSNRFSTMLAGTSAMKFSHVLFKPGTHLSWEDLFEHCVRMECGDPRDKIYALLSLAEEFDIAADYTISVEELYRKVASEFAVSTTDWGRGRRDYLGFAEQLRKHLGLDASAPCIRQTAKECRHIMGCSMAELELLARGVRLSSAPRRTRSAEENPWNRTQFVTDLKIPEAKTRRSTYDHRLALRERRGSSKKVSAANSKKS